MKYNVKESFLSLMPLLFLFSGLNILIFMQNISAQSESQNVPSDWRTFAEQTNYRQTPRYVETVAYSKKLAAASDWIVYKSFGKSGEGRDLPLLIASKDRTFTPETARKKGKAVILIQA
ncbi:MAG: hypothetical protein ACR2L1_00110, partial [Pyrinomonadaceae bacterium]